MMRQGIEAETTIKIPKCDGQKRSTNQPWYVPTKAIQQREGIESKL